MPPELGDKANHAKPSHKLRRTVLLSSIVSYDHLMEASQQRLDAAAHSGVPSEELIAARILDNPKDFSRWENHHSGLMRRTVSSGSAEAQKSELLSASLGLIHRKALFEYLQANQVNGNTRVHLFKHFFGYTDYATSVISEHGNYLRSAASYLCSSHVGRHLLLDDIFDQPLSDYERLYAQYFRVYCGFVIAADDTEKDCVRPLLASLKREVSDWRGALLALAHSRSGIWRTPAELLRKQAETKF